MSQTPQRPYVPHRTPARGQPVIPPADFALARPFVPGADRLESAMLESTPAQETAEPVASITEFLAAPRPIAPPPPVDVAVEEELLEDTEELPPLEHFLDPLPPISEFSPHADEVYAAEASEIADEPVDDSAPPATGGDWVETDWQRYDWKSAAALGDAEKSQDEASNAWATTDWEIPSPRRAERLSKPPADAIASALDQIAERIRNGNLPLPGDGSVADPATIAATLAALLGVRR